MVFTKEDFTTIDKNYFNICELKEDLIHIESKNTLHSWKIVPEEESLIIYHKHFSRGWHYHREFNNLSDALFHIQRHDITVIKRIKKNFKDNSYDPTEKNSKYFYF